MFAPHCHKAWSLAITIVNTTIVSKLFVSNFNSTTYMLIFTLLGMTTRTPQLWNLLSCFFFPMLMMHYCMHLSHCLVVTHILYIYYFSFFFSTSAHIHLILPLSCIGTHERVCAHTHTHACTTTEISYLLHIHIALYSYSKGNFITIMGHNLSLQSMSYLTNYP